MLTGLIAGKNIVRVYAWFLDVPLGSATTIISNPVWVIQTSQAVQTMGTDPSHPVITKKLGFFETIQNILAKDGVG